jgi:hypothetical protein
VAMARLILEWPMTRSMQLRYGACCSRSSLCGSISLGDGFDAALIEVVADRICIVGLVG